MHLTSERLFRVLRFGLSRTSLKSSLIPSSTFAMTRRDENLERGTWEQECACVSRATDQRHIR